MDNAMKQAGANVLWHSHMTEFADMPGLVALAEEVYNAMDGAKPEEPAPKPKKATKKKRG